MYVNPILCEAAKDQFQNLLEERVNVIRLRPDRVGTI